MPDTYRQDKWFRQGRGPRYLQLYRYIAAEIGAGRLQADSQIPPERELAQLAGISRVTLRKTVARLVEDGLIEQRRGAGSFVRMPGPKLKQSLSRLTSFTEYMQQRGKTSSSQVIASGHFQPTPDEQVALGIASGDLVARIERLRSADGTAMAIERSSLPQDILPHPEQVETSLYTVLRRSKNAPVRAVQRITAVNLALSDAQMLDLPEGAAVLRIDRTAYLDSGRPVEFTRGLYRSDIYDFVADLRLDGL
ncbi:MAG: GntR family transcriptional regulator [Rhodobacteraceae bacterium]|nr:GntR family transcriptional regulator [Paracoccaceae bacterium]